MSESKLDKVRRRLNEMEQKIEDNPRLSPFDKNALTGDILMLRTLRNCEPSPEEITTEKHKSPSITKGTFVCCRQSTR